jgi:hypothetical protein
MLGFSFFHLMDGTVFLRCPLNKAPCEVLQRTFVLNSHYTASASKQRRFFSVLRTFSLFLGWVVFTRPCCFNDRNRSSSSHDVLLKFNKTETATRPSWFGFILLTGSSLLMTLSFARMGDATCPSWFGLIFCDGLLSSHDTLFYQDGRCYSTQLVWFDIL